ncbi:MurR/RpiR family transcriptional regulator [Paenisporosarcina antarctica]|uniref:MurR/RpiR family transcriptional regulator n=1 Tax=Paenisporosarcina antarctica TaxID=417367 RepID=A0A4P7A2N9_9BACL|nr:MurR/RpiR family transcriptional regulator [Paenisporosarcina antarctica]QBP42709.1 MurR/RpiR family transcriptional regulator [Paenisporosarcina antarctica]
MSDTITILRNKISDLTDSQKMVGNYILKNPSEVAFLTVDELSRQVGTSTTTIMRLSVNLGYSGYTEFQKGLQTLLRNQTAPFNRLEKNVRDVSQDNLWVSSINYNINQIQSVTDLVTDELLELVIEKIMSAKRIFCVSVRSGLPVGQYLTHGINRTLGNCKLIEPDNSEWIDDVISFDSSDLVIATSFPRYAKRIIDFVSIAREYNASVVSITDNYSSPIVNHSDIVLPCDSSSMAFHNSPLVAMIVADYLISAIAIRNLESTKKRLNEVNALLSKVNYHIK